MLLSPKISFLGFFGYLSVSVEGRKLVHVQFCDLIGNLAMTCRVNHLMNYVLISSRCLSYKVNHCFAFKTIWNHWFQVETAYFLSWHSRSLPKIPIWGLRIKGFGKNCLRARWRWVCRKRLHSILGSLDLGDRINAWLYIKRHISCLAHILVVFRVGGLVWAQVVEIGAWNRCIFGHFDWNWLLRLITIFVSLVSWV